MGDLVTLFPKSISAPPLPDSNSSLSPQSEMPLGADAPASSGPLDNTIGTAQALQEPLLVAAFTKMGELSAPFVTRLFQGRLAEAGSKIGHKVQDLRTLARNGATAVRIEQLVFAFERENSALKMQSLLEQIVALGEEGIERLAVLYKTSVMRAAHPDILGELRLKTLVNVLTQTVEDQFENLVAPEKILDEMLIAQMISDRPVELQLVAECLAIYGTLGERRFKLIFQGGGIVVDEKGTRNFDRFTISAEVYLNQLEAEIDAAQSDNLNGIRRDFKLTLSCLRSLQEHAVDSDLRCRILELIFRLRHLERE